MPLVVLILLIATLVATACLLLIVTWQLVRERARLRRSLDVVMMQVLLPKDLQPDEREEGVGDPIKERIAVAEQWLSTFTSVPTSWWDHLLYGQPILVLEIVAHGNGTIAFYAGTERRFADHLERQLYSFYPDAEVRPSSDHTIFETSDVIRAGRFTLRRASHVPLATYYDLEADPMQSLTGALAKLAGRDSAMIQFVCRPASPRARRRGQRAAQRTVRGRQTDVTKRSLVREVTDLATKSQEQRERARSESQHLTTRGQERIELVEQKGAQPQFETNIRVGVAAGQPEEAERIFNGVVSAFAQYDLPDLNGLKLVPARQPKVFIRDLIFRVPRPRQSNILSTTELTSLFHFPLPTTPTPNILWRGAKLAPPPAELPREGIQIGENHYRGVVTPIYVTPEDRRRHLYLVGQTGTGKSTLFLNMVEQDMRQGHGLAVVDPHGDLIEDILLRVPPERAQDVILFDPRDTERPLGFNILEAADPGQRDLIVNEVVEILQKLAAQLNPESVGPMFEHYVRNALLALAEDPEATLLDVPRMFVDETFRKQVLSHNPDPTVRQFWEQEFAQSQRGQMSADMLSYVISKLGRFISNRLVRNVIGQPHSSFDVRDIMDNQKILLCNLSKGQLGETNAALLGFVLVSKIQIAALSRANVAESERPDFYLYIDEFQNFTTDSIAIILSEARKYRLNLNLTHQFIQQLEEPIRDAVFGNVGTIVSYRIGAEDAEFMVPQFEPVFAEYDLVNLERFTACVRLLVNGTPARPFSLRGTAPSQSGDVSVREAIREHSRTQYGRDRAAVEQRIIERFNIAGPGPAASSGDSDYLSESLFDIS